MSLSGMFNIGHDIGGFAGPAPDPELLIRWTQAGVLHPRFLMNSWKPDGVTTSPWLHPEALPAIREALRLRLRLMPYLYSAMRAAHESHVPVLTPTFVLFEDDPCCFIDADALMFGPSLLAAPVTAPGAREVEVYLPARPGVLARLLDRRSLLTRRDRRRRGAAGAPAAARAGRRDHRDHRRRGRLFAPPRRAVARAANLSRRALRRIDRGSP